MRKLALQIDSGQVGDTMQIPNDERTLSDKIFICTTCSRKFGFTDAEQFFFLTKYFFNEPRHCTKCKAKQLSRGARVIEESIAICASCGVETTAPSSRATVALYSAVRVFARIDIDFLQETDGAYECTSDPRGTPFSFGVREIAEAQLAMGSKAWSRS